LPTVTDSSAMTEHKSGRAAERSCLVCRKQAAKPELLRLVVDEQGQILPDVFQKAPGRGAYICWQNVCFTRLHDKQLAHAWKRTSIAEGQALALPQRVEQAVLKLCRQMLQRRMNLLSIGRDAVMHRMWAKAPMLVLLAEDAGAALVRQVRDACDKRKAAKLKTALVIFGDSATLGELVQREAVSVLAFDDSSAGKNLRKYCLWLGQLRETE